MRTLTIRKVPQDVVDALRALAHRERISVEQLVRNILEAHALDRQSAFEQIEASWERQTRPTNASEVQDWIRQSRP
jgi:plasmid stability protein